MTTTKETTVSENDERLIIYRLSDLHAGDVLVAVGEKVRQTPLTVQHPLGPIAEERGSVHGVRFVPPTGSQIDWVFYPLQMDGLALTALRPAP